VVTAFRPQAGNVFTDGGKGTGLVTGVGAELSGVLVAGLAPTSSDGTRPTLALWGQRRGRLRRVEGLRSGEHGRCFVLSKTTRNNVSEIFNS